MWPAEVPRPDFLTALTVELAFTIVSILKMPVSDVKVWNISIGSKTEFSARNVNVLKMFVSDVKFECIMVVTLTMLPVHSHAMVLSCFQYSVMQSIYIGIGTTVQ